MNEHDAAVGLQTLDYIAVVGYLAITALIVYWSSRKQDDTEDFFLGGRSMPWFAVGLSIMATLLSTNTYLGAPGEMIKYGPAYLIGYLAYPAAALVIICFWIPFFMRLRMTSAYEYLERRFDHRARWLGGLLFLCLRLGWMSMVVYTASMAMVTMAAEPLAGFAQLFGASHPIYPVIAVIGLVASIYACIGGIRAVIWTDVLQALMLFGGVVVIIGYVMWHEGTGVGTWWTTIASHREQAPPLRWLSADITERTTVIWAMLSIFAWNVCTNCCDQVALQRYFSTESLPAARNSSIVNIISAAVIVLLLSTSGLALRYFYLEHASRLPAGLTPESGADQLMPFFYAYQLPVGFGGLILVSFLCDAMQTLGSGVNSIAAVITTDVTGAGRRNGGRQNAATRASDLRSARFVTLATGALTTVLAMFAANFAIHSGKTIFDMLPRMFNMFLGPLASMFMIGMFFRRATGRVIVIVVVITQVFSSLWSWWGEVPVMLGKLGMPGLAESWVNLLGVDAAGQPKTPSVMLAIAVPVLFGLATGWLFSRLLGSDDHPGADYSWRRVMNAPPPLPNSLTDAGPEVGSRS
jgi:SSS family solute:Na+ symporter